MTTTTIEKIIEETDKAQARFGKISSPHETLGVMLEEFDEMKAAVYDQDFASARKEAIQIASVALRFASTITTHEEKGSYNLKPAEA